MNQNQTLERPATSAKDDSNGGKYPKRGLLWNVRKWWKRKRSYYLADVRSEDDRDATMDEGSVADEATPQPQKEEKQNEGQKNRKPTSRDRRTEKDQVTEIISAKTLDEPVRETNDLPSPSSTSRARVRMISSRSSPRKKAALGYATPPRPSQFIRNRTKDSFQGSLESIDSLAESYWDPDDDGSQLTPIASNLGLGRHPDFLAEHVHFLRDQTQPRKVEVVYRQSPVQE